MSADDGAMRWGEGIVLGGSGHAAEESIDSEGEVGIGTSVE